MQGGYTSLHKAAGSGHLDVLELLINEGCDIDTQDDMVRRIPTSDKAFVSNINMSTILYHHKSQPLPQWKETMTVV